MDPVKETGLCLVSSAIFKFPDSGPQVSAGRCQNEEEVGVERTAQVSKANRTRQEFKQGKEIGEEAQTHVFN